MTDKIDGINTETKTVYKAAAGMFVAIVLSCFAWLLLDHIRVSTIQAERGAAIKNFAEIASDVKQINKEIEQIKRELQKLEYASVNTNDRLNTMSQRILAINSRLDTVSSAVSGKAPVVKPDY